jgi:NTP pyrophosphatase (non-canonical NTP hydrolase)
MSSFFNSMVEFADKFVDLVRDQSRWSQATFGSDQERGPMGALKHLEKEARECQEAVGTPELREELADCFLLLLDASRRAGIKPTQLVEAAQEKMAKNKLRTWPKPTPDQPVEHVR